MKQYSFAKAYVVNYDILPQYNLSKNEKISIIEVVATGAEGISLTFDAINRVGDEIFVFDKKISHLVYHKFDDKLKIFPTAFIPADTIYVEYHSKSGRNGKISKVGAAYRPLFNDSQWCEVDINCDTSSLWQKVKHSVVKIEYQSGLSYYVCTGTLLSNTEYDDTPYLLTANHCINTQKEAESAVFYFNYEKDSCDADTAYDNQTISGSELIATADDHLDFSLLKLSDVPYESFEPYYSGWDLTTSYSDTAVCIHHPAGDVKKISYSWSPIEIGSFSGYDENTHWHITEWNSGSTEGGSSGSGLFTKEGLLFGTLSGGNASCDNNYDDYFEQFYREYNDYYAIDKQLRNWLNPSGISLDKMPGYYLYKNNDLPRPQNLKLLQNDSLVTVSWEASPTQPVKYFLYRNFEKIAEFDTPQNYDDILEFPGVYAYYVTAVYDSNEESKPSNIERVLYGDTSTIQKVMHIKLFPNPTNDYLYIYTPDTNALHQVDVIDETGRIIIKKFYQKETKIRLDLTALKPSTYFLRLRTTGDIYYRKIVIIN